MHSEGLELTKLTYTRFEHNLICHRGDRLTNGISHQVLRTGAWYYVALRSEELLYTHGRAWRSVLVLVLVLMVLVVLGSMQYYTSTRCATK